EELAQPAPICLLGLLVLLEKPPESLRSWVLDSAVPVEHKTGVLSVLEEELPEELNSTLPAFISAAQAQSEAAPLPRNGATANYIEGLFSLLLRSKEQLLPALPAEALGQLRDLARRLIVATAPNSSIRAALLLQFVGQSEDAEFIEAYRPTEPILAKVFDEAAQALRGLQKE
ncbi:MAG TPA: hypothetical protein VLQ93_19615, partial [Myxococcaceae bacterium]|nr:hypothetical protein [Myxococcaceae bacterium]